MKQYLLALAEPNHVRYSQPQNIMVHLRPLKQLSRNKFSRVLIFVMANDAPQEGGVVITRINAGV